MSLAPAVSAAASPFAHHCISSQAFPPPALLVSTLLPLSSRELTCCLMRMVTARMPVFLCICTSQPNFLQVDVLEYYDVFAHSAHAQFMLPAVLRVRMYVQRDHHGRIALSRRNIMLRDGLACQ